MTGSKPLLLAGLSVSTLLALGTMGWVLHPEQAGRWAFVIFVLPGLWALSEAVNAPRKELLDWLRIVFAWAAALTAIKAGYRLGVAQGWLDPAWLPAVRKLDGILFGVGVVLWGNTLPKLLSPWSVEEEPFDWQRVHRFCGWVATLGGTASAGAWLALPPDRAAKASAAVIVAMSAMCVGRKLHSVADYSRRTPAGPPPVVATRRPSGLPPAAERNLS